MTWKPLAEEIAEELDDIYDTVYRKAFKSKLLRDLIDDRQHLFAAPAHVIADSPDKLINEVNHTHMRLARELGDIIQNAEKEAMFISPYYVPGNTGVQMIRDLVQKEVRVLVITNSLASNNHVPVHAAYARYRRDVIEAGAELYEIRANAARNLSDTRGGPDKLTLHTKAIYIDHKKIFVGSLNLDPRSIELNAEMGLLIESEAMVERLLENREKNLATNAYRVQLNDNGDLEWHCTIENRKVIEIKEPQTSRWLRFKAWLMKIAPESQL
jgi:putative cardiolipin synthase